MEALTRCQRLSLLIFNGILVVADKYELIHLLRPFADRWAEALKRSYPAVCHEGIAPLLGSTGSSTLRRIHAARELGDDGVVAAEITNFAFKCSHDGTSFKHGITGEPLEFGNHFGPPDLERKQHGLYPDLSSRNPSCPLVAVSACRRPWLTFSPTEWVSKLRHSLIQRLLDFYHAEIRRRKPPKIGCVRRHSPHTAAQCDTLVLGGMLRHLWHAETGLLPKKAPRYSGSVHDLMATSHQVSTNCLAATTTTRVAVLPRSMRSSRRGWRRDESDVRKYCRRITRSAWPHIAKDQGSHQRRMCLCTGNSFRIRLTRACPSGGGGLGCGLAVGCLRWLVLLISWLARESEGTRVPKTEWYLIKN